MNLSVLMSVYANECASYLAEALRSLADQTLKANEVVLVEDGPICDDLLEVIESLRSELNIKSVKLPQNMGLAYALNEGLKQCSYELVARMDSDDVALPGRFEIQLAAFCNDSTLDIVGSFVNEFDSLGQVGSLRTMPETHDQILENLWACPLIHPTVMFRREKVELVGSYNVALKRRQDYELWFRCAAYGLHFANIAEPLLLYRFDHNTHKKQTVRLAWQQALVGYRGAKLLKMVWWKRFACFVPFVRSLLPLWIQHYAYQCLNFFDPRHATCDVKK